MIGQHMPAMRPSEVLRHDPDAMGKQSTASMAKQSFANHSEVNSSMCEACPACTAAIATSLHGTSFMGQGLSKRLCSMHQCPFSKKMKPCSTGHAMASLFADILAEHAQKLACRFGGLTLLCCSWRLRAGIRLAGSSCWLCAEGRNSAGALQSSPACSSCKWDMASPMCVRPEVALEGLSTSFLFGGLYKAAGIH